MSDLLKSLKQHLTSIADSLFQSEVTSVDVSTGGYCTAHKGSDSEAVCLIRLSSRSQRGEAAHKIRQFTGKSARNCTCDTHAICWLENLGDSEISEEQIHNEGFRFPHVSLPHDIDELVYDKLGASYQPDFKKFSQNLELDKENVLQYLGTYFPRSFSEAYSIVKDLLKNDEIRQRIAEKEEFNILDIGSGTGGNVIGTIVALSQALPLVNIKLTVIEGNRHGIRYFERILMHLVDGLELKISSNVIYSKFQNLIDLYDDTKMYCDESYDLITTSKLINELIAENPNSYYDFLRTYSKHLSDTGLLIILDVTTKIDGVGFIPVALNRQATLFIKENIEEFKTLLPVSCSQNDEVCNTNCFSQKIFEVSHSNKLFDRSKVTFRVIGRYQHVNNITSTRPIKGNVIKWNHDLSPDKYCEYTDNIIIKSDAFSLN